VPVVQRSCVQRGHVYKAGNRGRQVWYGRYREPVLQEGQWVRKNSGPEKIRPPKISSSRLGQGREDSQTARAEFWPTTTASPRRAGAQGSHSFLELITSSQSPPPSRHFPTTFARSLGLHFSRFSPLTFRRPVRLRRAEAASAVEDSSGRSSQPSR